MGNFEQQRNMGQCRGLSCGKETEEAILPATDESRGISQIRLSDCECIGD